MPTQRALTLCLTCCLTAALLLSPFAAVTAADDKPPATVSPIAIAITKQAKAADGEDIVFGQEGTEVTLLIRGGDKNVIAFNDDRSELTSLKDSLGNKLNKPDDWGFQFWQPSDDGSAGTLKVSASGVPGKKATGLELKASLALVVASKQKTEETKNVSLTKDTSFKVGSIGCKVAEAGKPEWGDAAMAVELEFKQDVAEIAEVVFLDSDGKAVKADRTSSSRFGFGDKVQVTYGYELDKQIDVATVQFKLWTDMEKVKVPVDLSFGLGL